MAIGNGALVHVSGVGRRHRSRRLAALVGAGALWALALASSTASAQAYPSRPVRIIVPFAASTPVDIVSRLVAERLRGPLGGEAIVVENRPGAMGMLGISEVLRQPADGHTLMMIAMPLSVTQTINTHATFDLRRDFVALGQTVWSYNVLAVTPSVNARSVAELVALMKPPGGRWSYASGGAGTPAHIAGEFFKQRAGVEAQHVPYNQFPQAIGDLLGGQVQYMFAAIPPVIGHVNAGRLRPLAVTGPQRLASLRDVPTMVESGFPDFVVRDWQGLLARAGTPRDVVERVNRALSEALASDTVRQALPTLGAEVAPGSPEDFARLIASEIERWGAVARTAGIRVD